MEEDRKEKLVDNLEEDKTQKSEEKKTEGDSQKNMKNEKDLCDARIDTKLQDDTNTESKTDERDVREIKSGNSKLEEEKRESSEGKVNETQPDRVVKNDPSVLSAKVKEIEEETTDGPVEDPSKVTSPGRSQEEKQARRERSKSASKDRRRNSRSKSNSKEKHRKSRSCSKSKEDKHKRRSKSRSKEKRRKSRSSSRTKDERKKSRIRDVPMRIVENFVTTQESSEDKRNDISGKRNSWAKFRRIPRPAEFAGTSEPIDSLESSTRSRYKKCCSS